nr:M14 family zinc carboxypeptidase [Candidatus Palauibacterales bacterium]
MDAVSDVTRRAARAGTALLAAALAAILLAPAPTPAQDVPTPESVIGFELGSDYRLADYDQLTEYYRQLDAASDRMVLREVGTSVQGRPLYVAYVSSRENLQNLEEYRDISRRLARAEVDSAEARRLSREGKAFVWIDAGLHSTEVSPAQAMPNTAYRLVTSEDPEVRKIRENTIVMLMPVMNPDGLDIVVDWYREQKGTRFETASL